MGIETTRLITRDPRTDTHEAQLASIVPRVDALTAPLNSSDVVNARGLIGTGLTLAQAEEWLRATVGLSRSVLNLLNMYFLSSLTILHTNNPPRSTNSTSFVLLKQTRIDVIAPNNTTVRVSVQARTTAPGHEAFIEFRRNGIVVVTHMVHSLTFITLTSDIPNCVNGSLIEVWGKIIGLNGVEAQNLQVLGEIIAIPNLATAVSINSVGLTNPFAATSLS